MKLFFICLFLFGVPAFSSAAIVINEVAWMGTSASANDEWIELYNNGNSSVDVAGWTLSDGMNLSISLTGSIASGQYAVLERTDDTSAPGVAFLVYVGVLSNSGATLSLYRADASLEDRVVGGTDWGSIGGDNVTKETAQYTTGGWITSNATPGTINVSDDIVIDEEEEVVEEKNTVITTEALSPSTALNMIPRTLRTNITLPDRVYVNQEVSMTVQSSGLAKGILQSLIHTWNFGDMSTAVGDAVTHRFAYPGEYVVSLHSQYKDYEASTRHTIVVLPVSFSMTTNTAGDVQVHNDARYEVDISGYQVVAGTNIEFPEGTILLPNATITIPKETLQHTARATLFDDTATQVASLTHTEIPEPKSITIAEERAPLIQPVAFVAPPNPVTPPSSGFAFVSENDGMTEPKKETAQETPQPLAPQQVAASIEAAQAIPEGKLPYVALLAVIGLGITAVFAGKVKP